MITERRSYIIYSSTENLVLGARSEKNGCPVNLHSGMMGYWNIGIMGLAEWDLNLLGSHGPEYNIQPPSLFDRQYSIIPPFHHSIMQFEV
jgi:hypothetical protein